MTGPDGNLWFTELGANKIGQLTPAGTWMEFTVTTVNSWPYAIAAGPDGNVWFTEYLTNRIRRVTSSGTFTEYAVPGGRLDLLGESNAGSFMSYNGQ